MYVKRDPFSHGAYRRFTLSQPSPEDVDRFSMPHFACDWCGQKPHRLYNYQWESDGAYRLPTLPGGTWFCHWSCFTSHSH